MDILDETATTCVCSVAFNFKDLLILADTGTFLPAIVLTDADETNLVLTAFTHLVVALTFAELLLRINE